MPLCVHALAIVNDLFDDVLDAETLDLLAEAGLLDGEAPPAVEEEDAPPLLLH